MIHREDRCATSICARAFSNILAVISFIPKAFDDIPEPAKGYVYHRLLEVLTGREQSPDFAKLTGEDRRAILEILLATKSGLPDEWKKYKKGTTS